MIIRDAEQMGDVAARADRDNPYSLLQFPIVYLPESTTLRQFADIMDRTEWHEKTWDVDFDMSDGVEGFFYRVCCKPHLISTLIEEVLKVGGGFYQRSQVNAK